MSLANLKVFNQYVYTTFQELFSYNLQLFNAATNGALQLRSAANQGDYSEATLYARIAGLVRRRNAYATGAVAAVDINMLLATSVKIAAGTPPVNIDPHFWQWILRSPDEAGVVIGRQLAEDTLADELAMAIKALVAALTTVGATVVHDGTAAVLSLGVLNSGSALHGDRAGDIVTWIMHSKVWHDMIAGALTNTAQLFTFGTVKVMQDGLGRPFVVTDQPDLPYVSTGTKYHTLGLVSGAALVEQNPDYIENMETKNGFDNITRTWQAQWSYNLALKGFAWDKTSGGPSPSTAAIATGTNWDVYASSIKDLPGVIVNSL